MLHGNYNIFNKTPGMQLGGTTTNDTVGLRSSWQNNGIKRARFYGSNAVVGVTDRVSVPSGYTLPYTWTMAPKAGGIGSNVGIQMTGTFTGNMAAGKNIASALSGSGSITNAQLRLVVSMIAALSGSGTITNGLLVSYLNMAANLAASGNVAGSLRALGNMIAAMNGSASLSPTMNATANMEADITPFTELSPESLAASVWNAAAAEFDASGTMGEKLNAAGTAGDPWTTDLTSYTTPGTAGKVLKDKLKKNDFIALK